MNYHDLNLNTGLELRATEHRNLANNRHVLRRSPIRSIFIKFVIFLVLFSAVMMWIGSLSAPKVSNEQTVDQSISSTNSNPE